MTPNKNAIRAHLNFLFKDTPAEYQDGRIEIAYTGAHTKSLNQANYFGIDEIDKAVDFIVNKNSIEGINIYVGAALRSPDCPPFGRSSIADYYASPCVWADIDDEQAANEAKQKYNKLPPHAVIVTGRYPHKRFQVWWKLKECSDNPDDLKEVLSGTKHALNGDPAVVDAARVMRVGGSVAWPKKEGRVTELTEFVLINDDKVNLNELISVYPPQLIQDSYTGLPVVDDGKPRHPLTGRLEVQALLEATKIPHQWNTNMLIAIASMVGRGWSDEQIRIACAPYSDGAENDGDIIEMLNRTRRKFGTYDKDKEQIEELKNNPLVAIDIKDIDLNNIPPRAWLFGNIAARKFVSIIGASPGAGKSIFTMQLGVCASADKAFGPHSAKDKNIKTWIYNNEEGEEEMRRRLKGIIMHQGINAADLNGKFFMNSGEQRSICIARRDLQDGSVIHTPDYAALKEEVTRRGIDLLIVDPFAETHAVSENSNDEIKSVSALYRDIAQECNCAVILVHHTRKGGTGDASSTEQGGNADNFRGAGSQIGVVRRAFTLSRMDKQTAKSLDVPDNARRYFIKLDDAKSNITAAPEASEWYKFQSVNIKNKTSLYSEGDSVGVLVHKTVADIMKEEGAELDTERTLLLSRLARIMINKSISDDTVQGLVIALIDDGYGKYKERKLSDFLKQTIEKYDKTKPIISEGYECKFDIKQGESKRDGNRIFLHIKPISVF